jgi:3-oxoacyl-[acyl-carrier-protein] synthase III
LNLILPIRIAGTATVEAGPRVATEQVAAMVNPPQDPERVIAKTGILARRFSEPGTSAVALGARALGDALDDAGMRADALSRIIFVTSVGGDMLIPANAARIAASLGIHGTCDGFDIANACMGFLSALDIAARAIATGSGPVAIVVVELGRPFLDPADARPFLVVGDAVAAVIVERCAHGGGILATHLRTDASLPPTVELRHPGMTHQRETIRFINSNEGIGETARGAVRRATARVLEDAALRIADVEWVLPHQPNGKLLDAMIDDLGLDPERTIRVADEIGSVGAGSIPVSLDRLRRSGRIRPGDRILMAGVGAGLAFGATLLRVAQP